jgi:hypothetical protein
MLDNKDLVSVVNDSIIVDNQDKDSHRPNRSVLSKPPKTDVGLPPRNASPLNANPSGSTNPLHLPTNTEQRVMDRKRNSQLKVATQESELSPQRDDISPVYMDTHVTLKSPQLTQIDVQIDKAVHMGDSRHMQPVFVNNILTPNQANENLKVNYPNIETIFKNAKTGVGVSDNNSRNFDQSSASGRQVSKLRSSTINSNKSRKKKDQNSPKNVRAANKN